MSVEVASSSIAAAVDVQRQLELIPLLPVPRQGSFLSSGLLQEQT